MLGVKEILNEKLLVQGIYKENIMWQVESDRMVACKGGFFRVWKLVLIGLFLCASDSVQGFSVVSNRKVMIRRNQLDRKVNTSNLNQSFSSSRKIRGGDQIVSAWPQARDTDPKGMPPDYPLAMGRIAVTIGSVLLTWYASKKYSPVLASAAVSVIGSLVSPGLGQAAMCGTFAGMSSNIILVNTFGSALSLGILTSIFFEGLIHYRNLLLGIGGRLGFVAFLANNALALLRGNAIYTSSAAAKVSSTTLMSTSLFTGLGAVLTIALREASDDTPASDPVRASAVIGLMAALLVGCHPIYTDASALAIYAGSFVGMSLPSRLLKGIIPNQPPKTPSSNNTKSISSLVLLSVFALAGVLGGMFNVLFTSMGIWAVPPGWGGKAGFTSMLGVLTCRFLSKFIKR